MKGLLIAICGLDGSGKSTQIGLLHEWFMQKGLNIHLTKQPTDMYRNDPRVRNYLDYGTIPDMRILAMLSAADRLWQMKTEIEAVVLEGTNVITDRYIYSSYAFFQSRGLQKSYLYSLYGDIRKPDLTVFLDLDPDESLKRVEERDGNANLKFEEQNNETFFKVRAAFLECLPEDTLIINAKLEKEAIHQLIINKLQQHSMIKTEVAY